MNRDARLLRTALERAQSPHEEAPSRLLLVDIMQQELIVFTHATPVLRFPVSTASAGVGAEEGSNRTPPGWHRIAAAIGAGANPGTVFESREPTGEVWHGEPDERDLILTRIFTLDGLEPGVNRGPGIDSLARYVYIHGTNHENALGRPASHGCIRMAGADVMQLFDFAREGDPVVLVELLPADPLAEDRFHYAGIGGSGMSAIAQFQVMRGGRASGSDRGFDRGANPAERARLEDLGIEVFPQDGSGARGDCAALVVSTAVEKDVPDVVAARAEGIPVVHRSDVLAHFVRDHRTIAVTGTSGKSTTAGMIFEILRVAGRDPSIITGGDLGSLRERGFWGNAYAGKRGAGTGAPTGKDLLVIEADESDGTLVHYEPAIGVVLNLQRDHREMDDVLRMFRAFAGQTREALVAGEDERLSGLLRDTTVFGFTERARIRGRNVETDGGGVRFEVDGDMFRLPVPGRHNVENALAAIAACRLLEVTPDDIARGLASFSGISRRFETVGIARGVEVVDDFAHNPAKIAAAIATAQSRVRGRVLAVYQPHGFGPTRFLRPDLVAAFSRALRMTGRSIDRDRLWLLDIFYAGGTAVRDISSLDLVRDIAGHGVACELASSRPELIARLAAEARPDDIILVMGARDPSLSDLARNILSELAATG